jgi:hypothetical protein
MCSKGTTMSCSTDECKQAFTKAQILAATVQLVREGRTRVYNAQLQEDTDEFFRRADFILSLETLGLAEDHDYECLQEYIFAKSELKISDIVAEREGLCIC